jgi:hypothetical protein
MGVSLTLTGEQHRTLRDHLFPGDGLEAVALMLCGRTSYGDRTRLAVNEIHLVPNSSCTRSETSVTWPTEILPSLLEKAGRRGLSIVKIHGHSDLASFSDQDERSDFELLPSVDAWIQGPHGSAIMVAGDQIIGRTLNGHHLVAMTHVNCVGDDLDFWRPDLETSVPEHARRVAQAFGSGTYQVLKRLRIGVVGCSGTGSVVIDQLARNSVGELVLVDPDRIETKNLNRIVNSRAEDADQARFKVDVLGRAVEALGFETKIEPLACSLFDPAAIRAIASCDIVFGCMDSVDGRHLLNRLATFYSIPYFDLGVKLEADGNGSVDQVCGSVHYLKPGGSSLLSRYVYTLDQVRAAGLMRTDPNAYAALRKEGYIKGVAEDRPAVIQLNSLIASLAINELLARLHPYRLDPNCEFAIHRISLSHGIYEHLGDGDPCPTMSRHVGRGEILPLLDMPELSLERTAA